MKIALKLLLILWFFLSGHSSYADEKLPKNSLSCLFHFIEPSWLGAHNIDREWVDQEQLFLETILMTFESMEELQRQLAPSVADKMGLDNSVSGLHLIQASEVALENFVVEIPGTESMGLMDRRRRFSELLSTDFDDSRVKLYWGYRAYIKFMRQYYGRGSYNTGFLDYGLDKINLEYYGITVQMELKASFREVMARRFSEEPHLVTEMSFHELVALSLEAVRDFETKIDGLRSPYDLVGELGPALVSHWHEDTGLAASFGKDIYQELTSEMDLSPLDQEKVDIRIEEYKAGIGAGVMLNLLQMDVGTHNPSEDPG